MSEEEIVKLVQKNARYYSDIDKPYSIGWNGKPLFADSPRNLVKQIIEIENKRKEAQPRTPC